MADEINDGPTGRTKDPYLELEYKECLATTRFTSGVRFTFFTAFVTLFGILVGAYHYVWTTEIAVIGSLKPYLMFGVSTFGFLMAVAALIIETRNRATLRTCADHAVDLEREMPPTPRNRMRLRERLDSPETIENVLGIDATHGSAIRTTYGAILTIWSGLVSYSIYSIVTQLITP